jgi:hypothetical protein
MAALWGHCCHGSSVRPLIIYKNVLLDTRQAFKTILTVLFSWFEGLWGSKNGY